MPTDGTAPSVYTIPAHQPFLRTLIAGLFARFGRAPLDLAGITLLLPSRRACRSLREAFLAEGDGTPMLLPRMTALGDIDADDIDLAGGDTLPDGLDLPPALPETRRLLLLSRLVLARDASLLPAQAAALARDLARLIDQAHTERIGFERLAELVPAELARHWQITLDFLRIVTEHWPAILSAEGALDPALRRNRLIEAQAALWQREPPAQPVIAAGFGGAVPAAADLLALLATLPQGAVVLPGVDTAAPAPLWQAIRADPTHPQHGLAELIDHLGVAHDALPDWHAAPGGNPGRTQLAMEAMRPASVSDQWRALETLPEGALTGLARLDCPGPQEEAGAIALLLRERLETPGATAMLVTPDRGLARRVTAELKRWKIDIDDSAGTPLNRTPPGIFLRLIADAVLERLAPVPLLALLKHPLAAAGFSPARCRALVRRLERLALRGPRPAPDLAGLHQAVPESDTELAELLARLEPILAPLLDPAPAGFAERIAGHIRAAETLAASDIEIGSDRLWAGEAGEALAGFVAELHQAAADFPAIAASDYPMLLESLLAGKVVRPRFGRHPRLQILGTLEARLQQADLVVLGGLNEGVWPATGGHDPWMSRPMRRDFGLKALEAEIGLSAQDFVGGFTAPEVVLTRALKAEGAPTVPSRWLLRLDTVLAATEAALPAALPHLSWQRRLDRPETFQPFPPPEPRPPVAARPTALSVTEIETWMRDPYAIYARHVLGLDPLDPLDADPGVAERGTFIHQALDRFVRDYPQDLPVDALEKLLAHGRAAFGDALDRPGVWAFWWPRFERIARWFLAEEAQRRPLLAGMLTERRGRLVLPVTPRGFTLAAKADRIDRLKAGGLIIIDYKTGALPPRAEVMAGFSPQLPLEAAIAAAGGFEGVDPAEVTGLAFWRLSGGDPAGEIRSAGDEAASPDTLASQARAGLEALIRAFEDPATPYLARPHAGFAPRYGAYGHLARLAEWGGGETE
jgi:ATP-dependent helicase/nuclease subunit B